jgi:hypothetical protein
MNLREKAAATFLLIVLCLSQVALVEGLLNQDQISFVA